MAARRPRSPRRGALRGIDLLRGPFTQPQRPTRSPNLVAHLPGGGQGHQGHRWPVRASLLPKARELLARAHHGARPLSLSLSLPHRYARRLLPKARELLANSASAQPNEPVHWEARLHLEKQCGSTKEVRLVPPTLAYPRLPPYPRPTPPASLALALGHGSAAAASRHEPRG